ncbi:hypothetical protein Ddc_23338 [Ditylenchus destructor]|nr:hypothetical protein Ddc_23338 [Ditylenchus destructor]
MCRAGSQGLGRRIAWVLHARSPGRGSRWGPASATAWPASAARQRLRGAAAFREPYEVVGVANEFVRTGDQGARFRFRFRFCPACGSNVFPHRGGRRGHRRRRRRCLRRP